MTEGAVEHQADARDTGSGASVEIPPIRWMSTPQVVEYLGVNQRTVYRLIDEGELAAYRFGRVIRLRHEDVVSYIERSRIAPGSLEHLYPEPVKASAVQTADQQ